MALLINFFHDWNKLRGVKLEQEKGEGEERKEGFWT